MVIFDEEPYKPTVGQRIIIWFKNIFKKDEPNFLQEKQLFKVVPDEVKKAKTTLDNVIKESEVKDDSLKEYSDFLKKKYHMIGSHNATISHFDEMINKYQKDLTVCAKRNSDYNQLRNFLITCPEDNKAAANAKKILVQLTKENISLESKIKFEIIKLQSKIQNRSELIGKLTKAKTLEDIEKAEAKYKAKSKQQKPK